MVKAKKKYGMGTFWFLLILVVSVIGAFLQGNEKIFWLILGISGAIVAIMNIRIREEVSFLIGTSALLIVIVCLFTLTPLVIPAILLKNMLTGELTILGSFLVNLSVAFSVAGFVVALGLISRLGLEK